MINKFDIAMLKTAIIWSELSTCKRRQVGAVIAYNNRIISNGYNGTIAGQDNDCEYKVLVCNKCGKDIRLASDLRYHGDAKTVYETDCPHCGCINAGTEEWLDKNIQLRTNDLTLHAEQNAITYAAKYGIGLDGSTIYITTSPCKNCAKLIAQAGIKRVVYLDEYKDIEGVEFLRSIGVEVDKHSFGTEVDLAVEAICDGSIEQWSEKSLKNLREGKM